MKGLDHDLEEFPRGLGRDHAPDVALLAHHRAELALLQAVLDVDRPYSLVDVELAFFQFVDEGVPVVARFFVVEAAQLLDVLPVQFLVDLDDHALCVRVRGFQIQRFTLSVPYTVLGLDGSLVFDECVVRTGVGCEPLGHPADSALVGLVVQSSLPESRVVLNAFDLAAVRVPPGQ